MKNHLINKLILLDVSIYRRASKDIHGVYKHEPIGYKLDLYSIYETMTQEQIEKLIHLKTIK